MRIVFLHLSDLHLQDRAGIHPAKIQGVVKSLAIYKPFDGIVVILSGDIAAKGEQNQYKLAATFLGRLTAELKDLYLVNEKNIKVLIVPGNHDVDREGKAQLLSEQIRNFSEEQRDRQLRFQLNQMRNYLKFSDKNGCFTFGDFSSELMARKILHFSSGYRIEANLINTAPFSCGQDDGLHYLPEEVIQLLTRPSDADMSIIVMHHSPDWFGFEQRKELEKVIAQRCSVAFYGHEHLPGAQHISYDNGCRLIKQAGGAWWQRSAPLMSDYYAALFDSVSWKYSLSKFSWDANTSAFNDTLQNTYTLMSKSLQGIDLIYQEDYIASVMADIKNSISRDISDYYVFLPLRFGTSKEYSRDKVIHRMEDLLSFTKKNKYVSIQGGSNSGKTTLLKMLFKELRKDFAVLYCGIDDITGRSQENVLKELVQNSFGDNTYSLFCQIPVEKKVILIDDLHRIAPKHLHKFLRGIEDLFGTIVVASEETSQFDVVQMVKDHMKSNREFKKASISRLYAEKRLELIQKIVSLRVGKDDPKAIEQARTLEHYLNSYKLDFRAEVNFVVQFVDYYCVHSGELDKSDATVFSKVFEASIESAIAPYLIQRRETPNDIIVALSEIAYYIHFRREYPISAEHIHQVVEEYCRYYDNRYLTVARFIEIAEASGLLVKMVSGYEYRFASKNHLAYFVAKALNRKFHDTGSTTDLETITRQACFGINGDILLFLTYISDNVSIPRILLEQAISSVMDWEEFDLSNIDIKYLHTIPIGQINAPEGNQREQEIKQKSVEEEERDLPIETLDIYDYDETQLERINNQLLRAFLQMRIISRNFSAFMSILPAQVKRDYVQTMYQLPNKIFNQWAKLVDDNLDQLEDEIAEWQKSPDFDGKKLSREDILKLFQDVSLNMLLNLYFAVSSYGVNNNTVDYLSQQDYIDASLNYRIQRLMFREKVDDCQTVIREAEEIFECRNDGIIRNLILAILHHLLIYSDKLPDRERRRISSKYFAPQVRPKILLERQIALKEKGI